MLLIYLLIQVVTPEKEFISQIYFKDDIPQSYETYVMRYGEVLPVEEGKSSRFVKSIIKLDQDCTF